MKNRPTSRAQARVAKKIKIHASQCFLVNSGKSIFFLPYFGSCCSGKEVSQEPELVDISSYRPKRTDIVAPAGRTDNNVVSTFVSVCIRFRDAMHYCACVNVNILCM